MLLEDGSTTSDIGRAVEVHTNKWSDIWRENEHEDEIEWPEMKRLPKIPHEVLVKVAKSFKKRTTIVGSWHPQQIAYLSEDAVKCLACTFYWFEVLGGLGQSSADRELLVRLLLKAGGRDRRPIAMFRMYHRLWGRCRRRMIRAWLQARLNHGRNNLQPGRQILDGSWRSAVKGIGFDRTPNQHVRS